jgi:hypothetical protein
MPVIPALGRRQIIMSSRPHLAGPHSKTLSQKKKKKKTKWKLHVYNQNQRGKNLFFVTNVKMGMGTEVSI